MKKITKTNLKKLTPPYLKNFNFRKSSLSAIFQAARLDLEAGRDIWEELERIVNWHLMSNNAEARKRGYKRAFDDISR